MGDIPDHLQLQYQKVMSWKSGRKPAYRKVLNIAAGIGIAVLAVAIPLAYIFLTHPTPTQAAWFNTAWSYRNAIPISSHTAAETNVYISVTINTSASGQFQADCGDLRFVNAASGKLLPYYVSSGCGTASTVVHVYYLSFPAGAQTVYYYYGNPSAPDGFSASDFSTEATSYVIGTVAAQEVGTAPVAYWKFDEGYGTVAHDSIVNNKDGTLSGTTKPSWQTKSYCMSGNCLYFEGSTAYVNVGSTVKSVKSVSFWIKPKTNGETMVDLDGGTHYIAASAGTITATGFSTPTYYINGIQTATPTLTANKWQQITVTTGTAFDASAITVGKHSTTYLNGYIDDFKLYDYARSAAQVKTDTERTGVGSTLGAKLSGTDALSNGLVGYWKMDDNTGTSASDASNNGNTGTLTNTPAWAAGKFGSGIYFDPATTNKYVTVAAANSINNLSSFTWSFWVNPAQLQSSTIMSKGSGLRIYFATVSSGLRTQLYLNCSGTGLNRYTTSSDNLTLTAWSHITLTYDGQGCALTNVHLYINGKEAGQHANSTDGSGTRNTDSGSNLVIGNATSLDSQVQGSLDDVRVYNRAFSATEVRQLYEWAPGPLGYWDMEKNASDTTVYDKTGGGADLTMHGSLSSASYVQGKFGNAMTFNGTSDYLDNSSTSIVVVPYAVTMSAWINITSVSAGDADIANKQGDYSVRLINNGKIGGKAFGCTGVSSNTTPNTGQWYFVTWTYDGSTNNIYLNGVLDNTASESCAIPTNGAGGVHIGLGDSYFKGKIDDVRIYHYVQSPRQIIQDMNGGHAAPGSPVGSALGEWHFEENTGDTINNAGNCGNTCNLTRSGTTKPTWTNSGKFGRALSYGGSNAYLAASSDVSQFKQTGDLTLSAWINLTNISSQHDVICKYTGTAATSAYCLTVNTSGNVQMLVVNSTGPAVVTTTGTKVLSTSTWYHIAGVFKSATSVTIYINGLQDKLNTTSIPTTLQNPTTVLDIGGENAGSNLMNGTIDEARIYASALTADEIKVLYNQGSALVLGTGSTDTSGNADSSATRSFCVPGDTATCTAPTYWWQLDENTGTATVKDSSGNGISGTIEGTAKPLWVPGKRGSALQFDGVDDDLTYSWTGGTYATGALEFYFYLFNKQDNTSTSVVNLFQDNLTGNNNGDIEHIQLTTAGTIQIRTDAGAGATNFSSVQASWNANQWYHIAYTWDASNVYLYINGDLDSTFNVGHGLFPAATSSQRYARKDSTYSHIRMDDIRIYSYTRSQAQVAWDYNSGKPVAQWKMNECSGTAIHDSSGNGLDGTLTVGATGTQSSPGTCTAVDTATAWYNGASGKYNGGLNFDGTDDVVNIYSAGLANFFNATQGTLMTWIKLNSSQLSDTASNRSAVQIGADTSNYVRIIKSSTANTITINYTAGGTAKGYDYVTTDTNWMHVTLTWDFPGNKVKVYINGTLRSTSSSLGTWVGAIASTRANIGARLNTATDPFSGLIDDVRLYNYPLTQQQVRTAMNDSGAVRFGPATGSP